MTEPTGQQPAVDAPSCYRHPDRETWIRCQRCERAICPDCMRQASVGFQCPECVAEGARTTRQARTPYGGRRPEAPGLVTRALLGINVVVFLAVLATGGSGSALLRELWLLPQGFCVGDQLGRCVLPLDGVADGAWWQPVTSMFTHVQVWHVGFNMLALYVLGPQLEALLGRWRFLALYLVSGLVGSATVLWLADPTSRTVGASGALFGLMAALLVVAVRARGDVQGLLMLVAVNVVITVIGASFISWQGHLGGFVGGLVLGTVLVYAPRDRRTLWQVLGVTLVGLTTVVLIALRAAALA